MKMMMDDLQEILKYELKHKMYMSPIRYNLITDILTMINENRIPYGWQAAEGTQTKFGDNYNDEKFI